MTTNVTTRRIRIAAHDGGEFEGYLAVPASGSGPGLVLCQEIFGLNGLCARPPSGWPRKVMWCWRRICSGASSPASN